MFWSRSLQKKCFFAPFLFVLLVAVGPMASADAPIRNGQGLLWQIQMGDGPPSHVFGSVHVTDPRVHDLPASVTSAFAESEVVAFEILLDDEVDHLMAGAMLYTDGTTLEEVAGGPLFEEAAAIAADYGIPAAGLQRFKPWAAAVLFSLPPDEVGRQAAGQPVLDDALQAEAERLGKRLAELETVAEQIGMFEDSFGNLAMLRAVVEAHGQVDAQYATMLTYYLARDTGAIYQWMLRMTADFDPTLVEAFIAAAIDERNARMVERMQDLLAEGRAFIVVGALHLPGDRGILHLLEQRGYEVTAIY